MKIHHHMVSTRRDPSGVIFRKIILETPLLTILSPGTEVRLGLGNEVKIFSDWGIFVRFGDAVTETGPITELGFTGIVDKIWIRKSGIADPGRIAIYVGNPSLGVNWRRENIRTKANWTSAPGPIVWPLGVTTLDTATLNAASGIESNYLVAIDIIRDAGTIETVSARDAETGLSIRFFQERFETPSDQVNFRPPYPIRIPGDWIFQFTGSNEPGATNLTYIVTMVTI